MFVKSGRFELEISEEVFVCLEEGEMSHFCEWSRLDDGLQETFKGLRQEISKVMEDFLHSEKSRAFLALSETYGDLPRGSKGCTRGKKLDH
ncbi:MAG: hypothetical protein WAW37_12645 [Syntrophobacteraceae bacterium]